MSRRAPLKTTFQGTLFRLIGIPFRWVQAAYLFLETLFFRLLFGAGGVLLKLFSSPWGLILPITGVMILLFGSFLEKQPRQIGLDLIESTRTAQEQEIPAIMKRIGKLDQNAIPAYVRGIGISRETVFFSCRDAIDRHLVRARTMPIRDAANVYLKIAEELDVEAYCFDAISARTAMDWARTILRDLLARDGEILPDRAATTVLCERVIAELAARGYRAPADFYRDDPPVLLSNGEPRRWNDDIDEWTEESLIARRREEERHRVPTFDRFAVERASELQALYRARSDGSDATRNGFDSTGTGDSAVLAEAYPRPLTMHHLAAMLTPVSANRPGNTGKGSHGSNVRGLAFGKADGEAGGKSGGTNGVSNGSVPTGAGHPYSTAENDTKIAAPYSDAPYDATPYDATPYDAAPYNIADAYIGRSMPADVHRRRPAGETPKTERAAIVSDYNASDYNNDNHHDDSDTGTGPTLEAMPELTLPKELIRTPPPKLPAVESTPLGKVALESLPSLSSPDLMRLMHHPDERYASTATAVLVHRDGFVDSHLRIAVKLYDPNVEIRKELPKILAETRAEKVADWVKVLLDDPSPEVRFATLSAFSTSRDRELLRLILERGKRDSDRRVLHLANQIDSMQKQRSR
ncbi:MAG TPA: hypothetical protein DEB39_13615 [Planctomycetaceae bacterium]|nr:hypothetical protein [Planctomycetaceae bacterium]